MTADPSFLPGRAASPDRDGAAAPDRAAPAPTALAAPPVPALPRPRGFWQHMLDRLAAFARAGRPAPPPGRSVAFTIAVIALGAKLAKADGTVARSEVAAFRRVFVIPRAEERNAARVFDLARQDVAGYDIWARRIAALFPPGDPVLADVVEGLYVIALADAGLHPAEEAFLADIAAIFGLAPDTLAAIRRRHDPGGCPPCEVLGIAPGTPLDAARARWRALVREAHPDRAIARGLPPEAVRLADVRTRRLNAAWQAYRAGFADSAAG